VGASSVPPIFGTLVPAEEPSTASIPAFLVCLHDEDREFHVGSR